jgi:hypothetical protein
MAWEIVKVKREEGDAEGTHFEGFIISHQFIVISSSF